MKKIFNYIIFSFLALAAVSCTKQDITFEHEQPAFATKDGVILLEAIMPSSTVAEDVIYICGPFNGGEQAISDVTWQLEKSENISLKWGIYLDPTKFINGKTLDDGFWFYSQKEGKEVTVKNSEAMHTLSAQTGNRYNVYVDRWASYYETPEEEKLPEHDGVRIYINDQTGWGSMALYQWGDVNDFGGAWPGMAVSGTETLAGTEYKYFQYTSEITGLAQNLIFNDNGGGTQLADYAITFDGTTDYFLNVTAEGVTEGSNPLEGGDKATFPAHDGVRVYVVNQTTWDAVTLYQWGDVNDYGGAWPGMAVSGTHSTAGVDYIYFEFGADIVGLNQHLIFNNNGGGVQLADYDLSFDGSASDYFVLITDESASAYDPGTTPTPAPDPVDPPINPDDYYSVYILDATGWNDFAVYSWGAFEESPETNIEAFGGWPGTTKYEDLEIGDKTYGRFLFNKDALGSIAHLIFNNNNGGVQFNGPDVLLKDNLFLEVTVSNNAIEVVDPRATYNIYVQDGSGWDDMAIYAWGGAEIFGGWPGALPTETLTIGGQTWKRYEINSSFNGLEENLIYNNNNNGVQFDGSRIKIDKDYWFTITSSEETASNVPSFKIYVNDQTGWGALAMYAYGDAELFGGWPGAQPVGTENIGGTDYTVFTYPFDALGKKENLIFNNNGGGEQLADYAVTLAGDMILDISNSGTSVPGKFSIYIQDGTGWDAIALYAWGDAEVFGNWPGALPAETLSFEGKAWKRFDIAQSDNGKAENLILNNNNGGSQFDLAAVTFSKDYWYTVTSVAGTEVEAPKVRVYVDNQTGWENIVLYQWGDVNNFGGEWPGKAVSGTENIGGIDYVYFEFDSDIIGLNQNLIFNNGNGTQLSDYAVTFSQDIFLTVTASGVSSK